MEGKLTVAKWVLGFKPFRRQYFFLIITMKRFRLTYYAISILTRISSYGCSPKPSTVVTDTCGTLIYIKVALDSIGCGILKNIILIKKKQIILLKENHGTAWEVLK